MQTFPTVSDQPFIISFLSEVSASFITGSHLLLWAFALHRDPPLQGPGAWAAAVFHFVILPLTLDLPGAASVFLRIEWAPL